MLQSIKTKGLALDFQAISVNFDTLMSSFLRQWRRANRRKPFILCSHTYSKE